MEIVQMPDKRITLENALTWARGILKEACIAEWELDAWYLLSHSCNVSRSQYYLDSKKMLTESEYEYYTQAIKERARHIPLQHITEEQEFMGLPFSVNKHVLIPRQDTEVLVEEVLKKVKPNMHILDLCTGSGCILISLKKLVNTITGTGADISEKALDVARKNAQRNEAELIWIKSDLFSNVTGRYHIIVSNPPYIPSAVITELMDEVRLYEPMLALDGSEDGLWFYKNIIKEAPDYLEKDGWLFFEIGCEQKTEVIEMFQREGYQDIMLVTDLAGLNRVVYGRWPAAES